MIRAMSTAATGMDAQQQRIDVTANNLSNVNTAGFKKSRAEFQDLLYQTIRAPGTSSVQGTRVPTGLQVGQGVRTVSTQKMFSQGDMAQTGNQLDIAVEGGGFFQVTMPDGTQSYTRAGNWTLDDTGRVVTTDGFPMEPAITVPPDAVNVTVGSDGTVSVQRPRILVKTLSRGVITTHASTPGTSDPASIGSPRAVPVPCASSAFTIAAPEYTASMFSIAMYSPPLSLMTPRRTSADAVMACTM